MTIAQPVSQQKKITTHLPTDLLLKIFGYLDIEDIQTAKQVNNLFQTCSTIYPQIRCHRQDSEHFLYPLIKITGWGDHNAFNPLVPFEKAEDSSVVSLKYSQEARLLCATSKNSVKILNTKNQELNSKTILGHGQLLKAVLSSDDNKIIWILNPLRNSHTNTPLFSKVLITNLDDTTEPSQILNVCDEPIISSALSADNDLLAIGLQNQIQIWNLTTGVKTHCIKAKKPIQALAFETSNRLAFGEFKDLKVWNLTKNMLVRSQPAHTDTISSLCINSHAGLAATGSADSQVKIWDLKKIHFEPLNPFSDSEETQKDSCKFTFSKHCDEIQALEFSASGRLLASASIDRKIFIWDVFKKTLKQSIDQYSSLEGSISFSPCETKLASTSFNGTFLIWNIYPSVQDYILAWLDYKIPKHKLPNSIKHLPNEAIVDLAKHAIIGNITHNIKNLSTFNRNSCSQEFMNQTLEEIQSYPEILKNQILGPVLDLFGQIEQKQKR